MFNFKEFYFSNPSGDICKVVWNEEVKEYEGINQTRGNLFSIYPSVMLEWFLDGRYTLYNKPEQPKEKSYEQIQLEQHLKIAEQSIEHHKRMVENYQEQIDRLEALRYV